MEYLQLVFEMSRRKCCMFICSFVANFGHWSASDSQQAFQISEIHLPRETVTILPNVFKIKHSCAIQEWVNLYLKLNKLAELKRSTYPIF